jgi:hypothetical protein
VTREEAVEIMDFLKGTQYEQGFIQTDDDVYNYILYHLTRGELAAMTSSAELLNALLDNIINGYRNTRLREKLDNETKKEVIKLDF